VRGAITLATGLGAKEWGDEKKKSGGDRRRTTGSYSLRCGGRPWNNLMGPKRGPKGKEKKIGEGETK